MKKAKAWCQRYVDEFGLLNLISQRTLSWDISINVATKDAASLAIEEATRAAVQSNANQKSRTASTGALHPRDDLIDQLLRNHIARRLAITGEGKSEYTRRVAYRFAKHFLDSSCGHHAPIPIHVQLRDMDPTLAVGGNAQQLLNLHIAPNSAKWMAPLADKGRIVFILDGFDELQLQAEPFHRAMRAMIDQYDRCAVILAGRPGSIPLRQLGFSDEEEHGLQMLTDKQIRSYVRHYFAACGSPALYQMFWTELESKRSTLFPLIQTPFMLAFAIEHFQANTHRSEKMPDNPAALIEAQLRRLFDARRRPSRR